MRVSDAFPSTYLKAADLEDKQLIVKIERTDWEKIGDDNKPVVYFKGHEKGLVLNKTNANNIAYAYGDEMDDWIGADVILFPTMVDFQGRSVPAIRVKIPPRRPAASPRQPATQQRPGPESQQQRYDERNPPPRADMDDEIPY